MCSVRIVSIICILELESVTELQYIAGKYNLQNEKKIKKHKANLNRFTERVLMINLPTAICLLLLVMIHELQPFVAVITFGTIVMVSILIIIPFMEQLQSVTDYSRSLIRSIDEGEELPTYKGEALEDEYGDIIEAINRLHNIWSAKKGDSQNNYLSDSAILDILPDPLLLLGENQEILGANLAARNLFGFEVRNMPLGKIITNEEASSLIEKVINDEKDKDSLEFEVKGNNAGTRFLLLKAERLPAFAKSGAIVAVVLHDVTEAKNLEKMQSDFVANASHELRTPLSVISGFIETLKGPAKDVVQAREKFLGIMETQTVRMSRLIENLLSLSRIQMQDDEVEAQEVNLKELITGIILTLDMKLKDAEMKIKMQMDSDVSVKGSASELSQVFSNLIDNALKYGDKGSVITISSLKERSKTGELCVMVSVHNWGEVIPEEQISRICERFYRVDTDKTRNRTGSGLGLAIVDRIIKRHKGNMFITSSKNAGTTFTVELPVFSQ